MNPRISPVTRITSSISILAMASMALLAQSVAAQTIKVPLDKPEANLVVTNGTAEVTTYRGQQALKLLPPPTPKGSVLAQVKDLTFRDGTIEFECAGSRAASAPPEIPGFIGVSFRIAPNAEKFEYIYLRPGNARLDDQLRRNHSVQYASHPDYPWNRLRQETPGKYEAYVDLEPDAWTPVKIVVQGTTARLYVHNATQPTLVVTDLKLGESEGGIALWTDPGTNAWFANLRVTPAGPAAAPKSSMK